MAMRNMHRIIRFSCVLALMTLLLVPTQLVLAQERVGLEPIPPPRTGSDLRELVKELTNATAVENRTDADGDGLFDPVENVIGTDPDNNDSDFDGVNDYSEVFGDTDPLEPDSNSDGLPDCYEIQNVVSLDIDDDGLPNAWDPDNDGDGVNDGIDLSPAWTSEPHGSFHFGISTDGNPLYVTFQLKPRETERLKLFYQLWDWPYDTEGSMRDFDNSREDVKIVPQLNLTLNILPDPAKVRDYGILVTSSSMYVPLNPVWEYGDIAAFTGKMFYPASFPMNLTVDAELIWRVIGTTDVATKALNSTNGKCVSIGNDGVAIANASEITDLETFQWIERTNNIVILKAVNGPYLSVADDGTIIANGTGIGDRESFELIANGSDAIALKAFNGQYVSVAAGGTLAANASEITDLERFVLVDKGYWPDSTVLVTYKEDFMLTGFSVEESYASDLCVFYSPDVNQTVAADLLLTYAFARNSTTRLSDMPSTLSSYNISVANLTGSFSHKDEAFTAMGNLLVPAALLALPESQLLPIIIAFEDKVKSFEISDLVSDPYSAENSYAVDLGNVPILTTKTMKTNWYNTSSCKAAGIDDIMTEIQDWQLSENVTSNLMTMMIRWNTGEQMVTGIGSNAIPSTPPENSVLEGIQQCLQYGMQGLDLGMDLGQRGAIGLKAFEDLSVLWSKGWSVSFKGKISGFKAWLGRYSELAKDLSKVKTGWFSKLNKIMGHFEVLGILVDIGFSILSGIFIAQSVGGRLGKEMGAQYGVFAAVYAVVMGLILYGIGQIPYVGWLISLAITLADIFGGFGQKLIEWLVSLFYGKPKDLAKVEPSMEVVGEPQIKTYDRDDNGMDVGDRIEVICRLLNNITGIAGREAATWARLSWYRPYISIEAPQGSYSTTNMTGVPPSSTWNVSSNGLWKAEEYDSGAWIEPGIGMPNFPVKIQLNTNYGLWHVWEHFEFYFVYWEWCRHEDLNSGSSSSHFTTVYFDVLPANISDFASWRSIVPLDHDGDGLKDSEEINKTGTNPWRYDTDADGLNDKFEVDMGTNPNNYDTDKDGLIDYYEFVYGTNATNQDSDGDRLPDYLEVAGWLINFSYCGQPFTMRVYSDPRLKNSDGDGVDDYMEYWSDLNPRSTDTDGDTVKDEAKPKFLSTYVEFAASWNVSQASAMLHTESLQNIRGIAVDAEGYTWVLREPLWTNWTAGECGSNVLKFDSDGELLDEWTTIQTGPWSHGRYYEIATDSKNGYIHFADAYDDGMYGVDTYYPNGTLVARWCNHTWPDFYITALTVDSDGYVYVGGGSSNYYGPSRRYVEMYNPDRSFNRTIIDVPSGTEISQLVRINGLAVDSQDGYVYVLDGSAGQRPEGDRIVQFDMNGNYLYSYLGFSNPEGLAVDSDGLIYVTDTGNHTVSKFVPFWPSPLMSWGSYGFEDGNFSSPTAITVDPSGYVYVVDYGGPLINLTWGEGNWFEAREGRVQIFSQRKGGAQDLLPDRDGEGLKSRIEIAGWDVTFTSSNGTFTIHETSDPLLNDTDFDGLSDYVEYTAGTNPRDPDTDDDGLSDYAELAGFSPGSNPRHFDTDLDSLPDGIEIAFGSDPTMNDTDGEGLSDLEEYLLGSNPTSADTDGDGLDDLTERIIGSDLNNADSDGDFMFDGKELAEGTDPEGNDTDGDGLLDGDELLFNANPRSSDSDGDNLTDGTEVDLWLNPASNDTDGDGLLDSTELEWGTNPWNSDTDGDGIPDGTDPDSNSSHVKNVILAYDPDSENGLFAQNLTQYTNVTIVSTDELLANYTDAPYIVLVGRPDGNGTVGKLVSDLLADAGDVLAKMIESDDYRFAVRYGIWNSNQTIVLLSRPYPQDHCRVLDIFRSKVVTILPDSTTVEYIRSTYVEYPSGGSLNHTTISYSFLEIGEIDTVKQTDSVVSAILDLAASPIVEIRRYNASTTPFSLNQTNGLASNELAVGRYLEVNARQNALNQTSDSVSAAYVQMYYKLPDLDRTGDGDANDTEDFKEDTLMLYFLDEPSGTWGKLSKDLDWVIETGVSTAEAVLYGENYAGYVWAWVSHLSKIYAIAGSLGNRPPDVTNAHASPDCLWPPNHKFVGVTIEGVTDPDGDNMTITIVSITSDEPTAPIDSDCDDKHAPDVYGVGTEIASLRAERLGRGNGRVYEITFMARDGKGGETLGTVKVCVPHDRTHHCRCCCIDDGQRYDATKINSWAQPDIEILNATFKMVIGLGFRARISVTVASRGDEIEIVNVTAYANSTVIGTQRILLSDNSATVSFAWDTTEFAYGNYDLSIYAEPVLGEIDIADNLIVFGNVVVTVPGDLDGDYRIGPADFALLAVAYGLATKSPEWNPNFDINADGKVNQFDFAILAFHYGQRYP